MSLLLCLFSISIAANLLLIIFRANADRVSKSEYKVRVTAMSRIESLIASFNKSKRPSKVNIALPSICEATGDQSPGESSVLETIVRCDSLSKGSGTERSLDMVDVWQGEHEYFGISPDNSQLVNARSSVAKLLPEHIESVSHLSDSTSIINKLNEEHEVELNHLCGPFYVDARAQLFPILNLCHTFNRVFQEHLDGRRPGGDQIYVVLENQLPSTLSNLPFDHHFSRQNVRKVILEADGYQPHLVAPEQGCRRLIEEAINYFRDPAEASVNAIHLILKELVRKSIGETQELKSFQTLQAEILAAANEALERFREDSIKTTLQLVDMEASYINVDFFRKLSPEVGKDWNRATLSANHYSEGQFGSVGTTVASYVGMVSETLKYYIPKAVVHCQVKEAKRALLDHFYIQLGKLETKQLAQLLDEDVGVIEWRQHCA